MATSPDIGEKLDNILSQMVTRDEIVKAVDSRLAGLHDSYNKTNLELQKLRTEKDFVWKREGHKIQFQFNAETIDNLKQAKFAIEYDKPDYLLELLDSEVDRIEKRNKHIKLADTSEGGWETVRQYETNELAENSEDERRMSRAENRAIKKIEKKRSKVNKFNPYRQPSATVTQSTSSVGVVPAQPSLSQRPFRGGIRPGACFACGDPSHWRRDCPRVKATAQSSFPISGKPDKFV